MIQSVIVFRIINHFASQVFALLNAIATYIDRDNYECLADLGQVAVACEEPANCHVSHALPIELITSEALTILENSGDLVVDDDLLHQCAIDKAALHGLSLLTTTANVTGTPQDLLHYKDFRDIIMVTECKAIRNALRLIDIDHNEKVDEGFV